MAKYTKAEEKQIREEIKSIAFNVKQARIKRKISQADAAAAMGTILGNYQRYESGKNSIQSWRLARLARYFNCSVALFFGELKTPDHAELIRIQSKIHNAEALKDLKRHSRMVAEENNLD